ncbi:IS3 family transposase [Rhodocytophaga aerolata]|uniref:IS3 family transposase n=1 Tax=Rhodocytophaga aerolata TaxID=455078 RepID=A0ABT8RAU3_9BACT|nr:IS3 family transposase [Rhodocytophaga aerolata]MDO1449175.1 IS3 family transposase [Rhodocytophaga aerolata]
MSLLKRRKMIEPGHTLSLVSQTALLGLHRSGLYYHPVAVDTEDLLLMSLLDKQYLKTPFYGYRKMTVFLQEGGYQVNHKRVRRLMRVMGIEAIYCRPNTSQANKAHKIYPYLLKGLSITGANQVWATDITYIPMKKGFMYLMAIIDLYSRYVLEWSISNTMESEWCSQTLKKALTKHGKPVLFNTDQGSQFTADLFLEVLLSNGIQPSMDGKGRAVDNIFVERLWRSVKYEDIYLKAYEDGWQLEQGMDNYFVSVR